MDPAQVKAALARLVNGVYVLTVDDGTEQNAMPVSWATQVSADPPLVAVAVSPRRYSHDMIDSAGEFALNYLSLDQGKLMAQFKLTGPDKSAKFEGVAVEPAEAIDAPLLAESPISLELRVHTAYNPGDHTVFVGEVVAARVRNDEPVLDVETYGKSYRGK